MLGFGVSRRRARQRVGPLAGFGGSVIGFLVGHELLGLHEMHVFTPEGLLPACVAAAGLLLLTNRLRRAHQRKTIFGSK